jgi:hypothetical protein
MWLDRLSGHSTPAATPSASPPPPANRAYSPAPPRRPSTLAPSSAAQRPAFNPRSSSLSLISNDSTTSLLSSRRPNGSALKQSVTAVAAPDPLEVLEKLLGPEGKERASSKSVNGHSAEKSTTDYDYEAELDFDGLSLREIVEGQPSHAKEEHVYTTQTIEECMLNWFVLMHKY